MSHYIGCGIPEFPPLYGQLPCSARCWEAGGSSEEMDEGSWSRVPRHDRICLLCNLGSLCDEKHVVFECPALQGLRDEYATLFADVCTMKQFLWQDDLVSVAKFIHACLDKMFSCATGLSNDSQASDQPDVASDSDSERGSLQFMIV